MISRSSSKNSLKDETLNKNSDIRSINDQTDTYSINTDVDLEARISCETQSSSIDEKSTKKKPWREIAMLSFTSLGAIYGDIGTSPLYVLNSIKYSNATPTPDEIYGAISIIFYLFTFIVIFKYVCIVLVLGPNNGEGGQVAIYAKIARYLNIGPKGVNIPGSSEVSDLTLLTRQDTTASSVHTVHSRIEKAKQHPVVIRIVQTFILGACFLGCSLVISDGLLTPTTSVLSAIGGIQIAKPSFNNVLAVSEVILILLFLIQRYGSHKISFTFAPIIFIWLIGLLCCGIYNIVKFHPGIFAALSPYYAIKLLRSGGIDVFSGAMLAITGTEALFSDIGHFGRLPVQITMVGIIYPCLIICYLGQGAYIVKHPEAWSNPFFESLPGGSNSPVFWIMFVLATLATIIASQALILAVSSIISQLINLDCFPKLKIVHVSSRYSGKVYIPTINWLLMIGVVCTTAGFKNSNNVTAAYGLGISLDFIVTSSLILICMFYVYNMNIIWPILFALIFVPLEVCLVVSNLKKVPHGAWFPILMAGLFFIFLSLWHWARTRKVEYEFNNKIKIGQLFPFFNKSITVDLNNNNQTQYLELNQCDVKSKYGNQQLTKYQGVGFMYVNSILTNSPNTLPYLYGTILRTFVSIPSDFIFLATRVLTIPYVSDEDRILMAPIKLSGHYKCILRFGFMENIVIDSELKKKILLRIPNLNSKSNAELENYPIVHFLENDLIKCKESKTNGYKIINQSAHLIRKLIIENFFSPLSSVNQDCGRIIKFEDEDEEKEQKLFIGNIARI